MTAQAEHPEPVVTRDSAGRRVTQHAFPAAELVAAERASRAACQAARDPFARISQTDDGEAF